MVHNMLSGAIGVLSLLGALWLAGELLPSLPGPIPVAVAETTTPATSSAEGPQGEVTERGLPGLDLRVRILPKLEASPAPPPELQGLQGSSAPQGNPQRSGKSVKELLDILRSLPGGREVLEDAKRRGARISSIPTERPASPLSGLNPFQVGEAYAQIKPQPQPQVKPGTPPPIGRPQPQQPSQPQGPVSITLTPAQPFKTDDPFYLPYKSQTGKTPHGHTAFLGLNGARLFHDGGPFPFRIWLQFLSGFGGLPDWARPGASISLAVPRDGWYLINVEGRAAIVAATLKKQQATPGVYHNLQSWNYLTGFTQARSFPVVVELKAGTHYFRWIVEGGDVYFTEVNIFSL